MASAAPLCFVLMPFGRKPGDSGVMVDFDAIYKEVIAPAIADAGLEPLRERRGETSPWLPRIMDELDRAAK